MTDRTCGVLDSLVKCVMWLLSLLYGGLALARRRLYASGVLRAYRALKPVISVGNITLGGAGKTPLVIAIVEALQQRQLRPAVLIRGYMPQGELYSDEALMLKQRLPGVPILTGADRSRSIEDCLKHHAVDVFVCDDAFGHLQMARDLNIVAVNAADPFGNGHVVPRGILREPLGALADADVFVVTKSDHPDGKLDLLTRKLNAFAPRSLVATSIHKPIDCVDVFSGSHIDLSHFKGISVVGFCGIGDTGAFRHSLQQAGFQAVNVFGFMDHHSYSAQDMVQMRKWAQEHNVVNIITTHKDAVKLAAFKDIWDGFKVYYLAIGLEITNGKNVFLERIMSVVRH